MALRTDQIIHEVGTLLLISSMLNLNHAGRESVAR